MGKTKKAFFPPSGICVLGRMHILNTSGGPRKCGGKITGQEGLWTGKWEDLGLNSLLFTVQLF